MLDKENQDIEFKNVVEFIIKNKFKFLLNCSIAIILSVIITYFIPNEYMSYGTIYPPSSNSSDNIVDNPNFGFDVEADRVIQILQSQAIKDSVTNKFKLYDYFEIDTKDIDARDQLTKKFLKAFKFERTIFLSVAITAQTKNPELSANSINFIIDKVNELREIIYKQNLVLANTIAKAEFEQQKHLSDSLLTIVKTDLDKLNLSGLLVLATNAQLNFNELTIKQASIENSNVGVNIINYRSQLERQREMEAKLFKLKKANDTPIPKVFVIDNGVPSYKKVFPSFTTNALIASIIALITTLFFLITKSKK